MYSVIWDNLQVVVLDEEAVVIPPSMESKVLATLHQSHQAVKDMLRTAKRVNNSPWNKKKFKQTMNVAKNVK